MKKCLFLFLICPLYWAIADQPVLEADEATEIFVSELESMDSQSAEAHLNALTKEYHKVLREHLLSLETADPEVLREAMRDFNRVNREVSEEISVLRSYVPELRNEEAKGLGQSIGKRRGILERVVNRMNGTTPRMENEAEEKQ